MTERRCLVSTLDNLKKDAKRWLKALRAGDASARERLRRADPTAPENPGLRDIQHALARESGHESWIALRDAPTSHRRTALHLAVINRQRASLATLIEAGADLNVRDATGSTPLDIAALIGDAAAAEALITAGARVTLPAALALGRTDDVERIVRDDPEAANNRLWARIVVDASARASGDVLDRVLTAVTRLRAGLTVVNYATDADVAPDGAHGYTALHQAAWYGNVDAIRVLLKHGADPRARESRWRRTPAGWAAHAGRHAALDLLLQADIDVFDAIGSDRADVVARVLDRDPDAIDRPFKAYASFANEDGQWWPGPDMTPLEWARTAKTMNAERVLVERGAASRSREDLKRAERIVAFLQFACWANEPHGKGDHRLHDRAAQRMLAQDPAIATDNLYTAIVCGEIDVVRRTLAADPGSARRAGGGRGWTPILYLAFTRFSHPKTIANALEIARLLLDAGASPSDFYMAGDSQYSALVGAAGEGEQDSPRQPYAAELFGLLLERGADPFDMQVLYNTHFSGEMLWWLEPVYAHTIATPRGAAWKDPEWRMFDMRRYGTGARFILETAIKHRDLRLAEWSLARGANPDSPHARDQRFPQVTLYEFALLEQQPEMAELLARYGAVRSEPALDPAQQFLDACLRLDRVRATTLLAAHPEYRTEPFAIFEAARRDNPDAIALLLDLGVPLEIQNRTGKHALHEAAWANAVRAAKYLIDRGAEIDPRESIHGGAPIGWAAHGDRREMMDLLSRYSRAIFTLCFHGYVDRVREILTDDPSLARQIDREGCTPLWWLPDDEEKAMTLVELLLAAGADPAHRNERGNTAADWARRRGMAAVAARLEPSEQSG
jgi:ankyrin repeat protein